LVSFFCLQAINGRIATQLTEDISIVFPDTVEVNKMDDFTKIYLLVNDSFTITAAVTLIEENVTKDSIQKINGHDANAFNFCKAADGTQLKTAWSKLKTADRIHFSFQNSDMGEDGLPHSYKHTGIILYHKQTITIIDFITPLKNEKNTEVIRANLFQSIEIH
ncbi:MAG: hypothetical protein LPK45_12195, partial [Bacteroidota bacterium]|nr:hypothetical protein [Bacteroidota bacterium]MDX5431870.1 hypothetical protein [Bacteroidota bacterium]MDX5470584.1 hypothetical protein [Bacteroidota bacterium]